MEGERPCDAPGNGAEAAKSLREAAFVAVAAWATEALRRAVPLDWRRTGMDPLDTMFMYVHESSPLHAELAANGGSPIGEGVLIGCFTRESSEAWLETVPRDHIGVVIAIGDEDRVLRLPLTAIFSNMPGAMGMTPLAGRGRALEFGQRLTEPTLVTTIGDESRCSVAATSANGHQPFSHCAKAPGKCVIAIGRTGLCRQGFSLKGRAA